MQHNFLEVALKYHKAGHRVLPVGENKQPTNLSQYGYKWAHFRENQTEEDVKNLFSKQCSGIAILTGINGLEVVDIDCKYDLEDSLMNDYITAIDKMQMGKTFLDMTIASTQNGGFHVFYRANNIEGNNPHLARREASEKEKKNDPDEKVKVLIETRGVGGYVLVHPSPGYQIDNGSLFNIPHISDEQRNGFLDAARSLNQYFDFNQRDSKETRQLRVSNTSEELTPWDDYNNRIDLVNYLESKGWKAMSRQRGERIDMRRPGKNEGISGNYHEGKRLFYNFSSSTELPFQKALTAYGVFTYLEHYGDFSESAKALYRLGYGSKKITSEVEIVKNPDDLWQELQQYRYDPNKKPESIDFVLKARIGLDSFDIGAFGTICSITGLPKSMKTTFLRGVMASGLKGGNPFINMSLDMRGRRMINVDTEQPEIFWHGGNSQVLRMAELGHKPDWFDSFRLRQYDIKKRLAVIEVILKKIPEVGCLVLDGIIDLVEDYNDAKEAALVINTIMRWTSEYNLLCFPVLHLGKSSREMLGALGSMLARKTDAEIRMTLDEDENMSEVKHKLSRTKPFKPYRFYRDDEGLPVLEVECYPSHPLSRPEPTFNPNWQPPEAVPIATETHPIKGSELAFAVNGNGSTEYMPQNVITRPVRTNDDETIPF